MQRLAVAKDDQSMREAIRRQAHAGSIAWHDANPIAAHVATGLRQQVGGGVVQGGGKESP